MAFLLGIDLGTSSAKAMLLEAGAGTVGVEAREYDVCSVRPGYAEQAPEVWWQAVCQALLSLRARFPAAFSEVRAVGLTGQMHGLAAVDQNDRPVRPAIVWLDQRSGGQAQEISRVMEEDVLARTLQNRIFPGFLLPSLLWVREQEPEVFERIDCVLLPKDYIRLRLTGERATDASDASASLAFDVGRGAWAEELLRALGLDASLFPRVYPAGQIVGEVSARAARETGLRTGTPVVCGAGDQPAQSIGNGLLEEGGVIANIGTGGQIAAFSTADRYDPLLRTQTFRHAVPGAFTIFGAALASGLSLKWLKNEVFGGNMAYAALDRLAQGAPAGSGGLLYLPYLSGERTPHMDPHARGAFFGLQLSHDRRFLTRAVMEGVVYSLRDSMEILKELGLRAEYVIASGGGARSAVWLQMQADIFESPVRVCTEKEQACLGACLLAGVGAQVFADLGEACAAHVAFAPEMYEPAAGRFALYREGYGRFRALYQSTRALMRSCAL